MKFLVVNKNTILVIKVFENNSRFFFSRWMHISIRLQNLVLEEKKLKVLEENSFLLSFFWGMESCNEMIKLKSFMSCSMFLKSINIKQQFVILERYSSGCCILILFDLINGVWKLKNIIFLNFAFEHDINKKKKNIWMESSRIIKILILFKCMLIQTCNKYFFTWALYNSNTEVKICG